MIVSGKPDDIDKLQTVLKTDKVRCTVITTAKAFHSSAVTKDIMLKFEKFIKENIEFNVNNGEKLKFRLLSNTSGKWIDQEKLSDPSYWSNHMRNAVRFTDQITTIKGSYVDDNIIFLECGPGKGMCSLIKRCNKPKHYSVLPTMRHKKDKNNDINILMKCIGQMYNYGIEIKFDKLFTKEFKLDNVRRMSLPTYAFDRQRCWVGPSDCIDVPKNVIYRTERKVIDVRKDVKHTEKVPAIVLNNWNIKQFKSYLPPVQIIKKQNLKNDINSINKLLILCHTKSLSDGSGKNDDRQEITKNITKTFFTNCKNID
eukprot:UN33197